MIIGQRKHHKNYLKEQSRKSYFNLWTEKQSYRVILLLKKGRKVKQVNVLGLPGMPSPSASFEPIKRDRSYTWPRVLQVNNFF